MKKIKVLHLIKTLALGGAEMNLVNLAQAFDKEQFEIHVGYSFGGELEEKFRGMDITLFKYAEGSHKIKSFQTIPIVLRIARYIKANKIDILHTHNFNAHVWGILAAKLVKVKVVEHVHDHRYTALQVMLDRKMVINQFRFTPYFKKQSHRIIVLTREQGERVVAGGFAKPEQVAEIQNGLPLAGPLESEGKNPENISGPDLREKLGLLDRRIILTSARIDPAKNLDLIFSIAPLVREKFPEVCFVIAGSGPMLEDYRAKAKSLGLQGHVRLIGFSADITGLLNISEIYLLPSLIELHSISILEAFKSAVPVVTSKGVGCNDEFIRNWENGVLLDPFQPEGWAEAVIRIFSDAELQALIGLAGRETLQERFDIRKIAAQIENVYRGLIPGAAAESKKDLCLSR